MPNGFVHVVLLGFDEAPAVELGVDAAVARWQQVETKLKDTYLDPGHERWFFHAFDHEELVFVVAAWQETPPLGGTYTAVQRIRVARSPAAVKALRVDRSIGEYEQGTGGVKAGMSPAEVEALRGKPLEVLELGPWGAFDWLYPDVQVRFLENAVAHLWDRSAEGR
jgi:hypothetical protein